jgi:hypothetical protein
LQHLSSLQLRCCYGKVRIATKPDSLMSLSPFHRLLTSPCDCRTVAVAWTCFGIIYREVMFLNQWRVSQVLPE